MQAIPLPEQFIHLLASVVLLLSFAMLAQPTDQPVWSKDQIQFGVRERSAVGPLLPQLGYKCVG